MNTNEIEIEGKKKGNSTMKIKLIYIYNSKSSLQTT